MDNYDDYDGVHVFWDAMATNLLDYEWFNGIPNKEKGHTPLCYSVVSSSMATYTTDERTYLFPRDGDMLVGFKLDDDDGLGEEPVTMTLMDCIYPLTLRPDRITLALFGRSAIPMCAYYHGPTVMTTMRQSRKFVAIYASALWSTYAIEPRCRAIGLTMRSHPLIFPINDTQCVAFLASMCGVGDGAWPRALTLPDLTAAVDRSASEQRRTRQRTLAIEHDLMRAAWHPSRMGSCLDIGEAAAFEVRAEERHLHDVMWVADGVCVVDAMFDDAECARLAVANAHAKTDDVHVTAFVRARLDTYVRWLRPCASACGAGDYVLRVFLRDRDRPCFGVRPKRGRAVILSAVAHKAHGTDSFDCVHFKLRSARSARMKTDVLCS